MRSLLVAAALALLAVLAACPPHGNPQPVPPAPNPGTGYEPPAPPDAAPASTGGAEGASCLSGSDCASGVCEGAGCGDDQPGTCAAAQRACTRDYAAYCGCDGQTFHGSGSCPGQRYSARGECANP